MYFVLGWQGFSWIQNSTFVFSRAFCFDFDRLMHEHFFPSKGLEMDFGNCSVMDITIQFAICKGFSFHLVPVVNFQKSYSNAFSHLSIVGN